MNLIESFLKQPFSVIIVEIYLFFVLSMLLIFFPTFTLAFISTGFTVWSIMYVLMYFANKD